MVTPFGNGAGTINFTGGNLITTADRSTTANNIVNPVVIAANAQFQSTTTTGTRNLVFGGPLSSTGGGLTLHNTEVGVGPATFNVRFTNTFVFTNSITLTSDNAGNTVNMDIWNLGTLGDQTYSGLISGFVCIMRYASTGYTGGRVIISGTNTFSGGTALNDGEIALGSDCTGVADAPTAGPLGTGAVTMGNNAGQIVRVRRSPQSFQPPALRRRFGRDLDRRK